MSQKHLSLSLLSGLRPSGGSLDVVDDGDAVWSFVCSSSSSSAELNVESTDGTMADRQLARERERREGEKGGGSV